MARVEGSGTALTGLTAMLSMANWPLFIKATLQAPPMLPSFQARLATPFAVLGIRTAGAVLTDIEYLPRGAATLALLNYGLVPAALPELGSLAALAGQDMSILPHSCA